MRIYSIPRLACGAALSLALIACGAPNAQIRPRPSPTPRYQPVNSRVAQGPIRSVRHGPTTTNTRRPDRSRHALPPGVSAVFSKAETGASTPGRNVLTTAREMMSRKTIIRGSCWTYANAVFDRAGHPNKRGLRTTVFKGSRKEKQFADVALIRPGDWLYYVNHQYRDVPHSAIFVTWLDRRNKRALMITYRGARRAVPGQLDDYDLSSVYRIVRPSRP